MQQERQLKLDNKELKISCIVPVHNEAEGIASFIDTLYSYLQKISTNLEIILVDDGSTDALINSLNNLLNQKLIKLIKLSRNFGKETALTAGLEHCSGEVVILIDADFQHPVELISEFIQQWAQGYDMVYGVRQNREQESWLKRWITQHFYSIMNKITQVNIVANAGDFRLLDQKVVTALNQCHERDRFMKGLYAWVGFKSIGIPFKVAPRVTGKSSWRFKHLAELAITGITSFSNLPLRIWSLVGLVIALFSFIFAAWICIKTFIFGIDVPGYASIMVGIFFFCGIQLLSIGILGEYIAKIFNEVKNRPKYIIEQRLGF